MEKNMTAGSPARLILSFTLPILLGNIFQLLYSTVDSVIVGQFVGTKALAAVGSTGTLCFLILGFLSGLTVGFTMLTGQRYGANDLEGMRRSVASATVLSAVASVIMTVVSMAGMRPLLIMMQTPEDIFEDAYMYMMILCGGIVAQVFYGLLSSVLRAVGNSRTPLYFLVFSALMNIVLDLVFILCFNLGVAGAAYATVISQGMAAVLCLIYIWRRVPVLKVKRSDFKNNGALMRAQLSVGIPMALQFSITAVGSVMVQRTLNILGSLYIAAFAAAGRIEQIVHQTMSALGTTMATYCAQNMGAGKVDRIKKGVRFSTITGCSYSLVIGVFLFFAGSAFTGLFVSEDLELITPLVDTYMRCIAFWLIPLMLINIYRNAVQAMGYGFLPMLGGIVELAARGTVVAIVSMNISYVGVCMAGPVAWLSAGIFFVIIYLFVMRKIQKNHI